MMSTNTLHHFILFLLVGVVALAGCGSPNDDDKDTPTSTAANETPVMSTAYTADDPAHLLIIHSYHPEYSWEQELNRGILDGLAQAGYSEAAGNIVLDYFWMDTKRQTSTEFMGRIGRETATYIEQTQPNIVIATDDNAFRLVVRPWLDESLPFVVAGLNASPEQYDLPNHPNVVGVLEEMHFQETMGWIKQVFPEAKNITLLSDQSATSNALLSDFMIASGQAGLFGVPQTTQSYTQYQRYAKLAFESSDVLVVAQYHTLEDDQGNVVPSQDVMHWLVTNSPLPVVTIWEFGVQDGALGGSVISGETQGFEAGAAAARILNGEAPQAIGMITPKRGKLIISPEAAARWDVEFPLSLLEVSQIYASGIGAVNR